MPAAELSRLKAQISAISTQFGQPAQFLHSLISLMELYADQHLRAGEQSRLEHLHPEYHLPAVVIQQLGKTLSTLTFQQPNVAMKTMDALKEDKHFEAKLLAAEMLGSFPPKYTDVVLSRQQTWIQPGEDELLLNKILESCNRFYVDTDADGWLKQIGRWLQDKDLRFIKIGLQALLLLINDAKYFKFEKSFPLLEPVFLNPVLGLQREALEVLKSLINRSEMESLAFVRSILIKTQDEDSLRFIRRCIPLFSTESQVILKRIPL